MQDQDQSDRAPADVRAIDWAVVGPRDSARLKRVKDTYLLDLLQTATDFSHEFCVVAIGMGKNDRDARWLAASGDRSASALRFDGMAMGRCGLCLTGESHGVIYGPFMRRWLQLATHPATVRRAGITAAVVGSVLVAINHGGAILAGTMTRARTLQATLTVLVPYVVSTVSSVSTRRELGG
jgi:hypothetical protein